MGVDPMQVAHEAAMGLHGQMPDDVQQQMREMLEMARASDDEIEEVLSGRVHKGKMWGGAWPADVAQIVDKAIFFQHAKSVTLKVSLSADEYHLEVAVVDLEP